MNPQLPSSKQKHSKASRKTYRDDTLFIIIYVVFSNTFSRIHFYSMGIYFCCFQQHSVRNFQYNSRGINESMRASTLVGSRVTADKWSIADHSDLCLCLLLITNLCLKLFYLFQLRYQADGDIAQLFPLPFYIILVVYIFFR